MIVVFCARTRQVFQALETGPRVRPVLGRLSVFQSLNVISWRL